MADISTEEGDGYTAIIGEERTYVPFCVVSKNDCGALIGYVNGDTATGYVNIRITPNAGGAFGTMRGRSGLSWRSNASTAVRLYCGPDRIGN